MDRFSASALRYDDSMPAPIVTARGRGHLARRMVELARNSGVPVEHAPELADRLIVLEPGSVIPEDIYHPVAQIFAFLMGINDEVERTNDKDEDDRSQ